jgi:UDP-galactopyranose mutase
MESNNYEYDFLIVGAGLFGATFAHEALKKGKTVLVIDKRNHIGGNCYTENIEGIEVHKYGPHIFHTNDKEVWDWISQFGEFNNFINSPLAYSKGKLYNLPFNMNTFYQLYGCATPEEAEIVLNKAREKYKGIEIKNLEDQALHLVGDEVYNTLIKDYTEKQWGQNCRDLPPEIITRLPLRFTFDNNYYDSKYQGVPVDGYTTLIKKMLKGADIMLNTSYEDLRTIFPDHYGKKVIYTGPIDEFFNYQLGALEWRGLEFDDILCSTDNVQGNAVINYMDRDIPYTRTIEHNHFNDTTSKVSIVTKEFPKQWVIGDIPYYPVNTDKNKELYKKYLGLASQYPYIYFVGRAGEYQYLDMDQTILKALELSKQLLK